LILLKWKFFVEEDGRETSNLSSISDSTNEFSDFIISRFKLKPGYSTLWRRFRAVAKKILNLSDRYQTKLTRFFRLHSRPTSANHNFITLRQLVVLTFSPFSVLITEIEKNSWYVNGHLVSNLNFYILKNDLCQLLVSSSHYYFITYAGNVHQKLLQFWKWQIKKKNLKSTSPFLTKLYNHNSLFFRYQDIPSFLEFDFYSFSAFVITEPNPYRYFFDKYDTSTNWAKLHLARLYNWKYIN
jgi:hypothetical protein